MSYLPIPRPSWLRLSVALFLMIPFLAYLTNPAIESFAEQRYKITENNSGSLGAMLKNIDFWVSELSRYCYSVDC
jgi:hypothetical protein